MAQRSRSSLGLLLLTLLVGSLLRLWVSHDSVRAFSQNDFLRQLRRSHKDTVSSARTGISHSRRTCEVDSKTGQTLFSCTGCQCMLPKDTFSKHNGSKFGIGSRCRICAAVRKADFRRTPRGKASQMFRNMKSNSIRRKHPPPSWTKSDDFFSWCAHYLEGCEFKCYVSGQPLGFDSGEPHFLTLERVKASLPYTPDNTVFSRSEFQSVSVKEENGAMPSQWTPEVFAKVPCLRVDTASAISPELDADIEEALTCSRQASSSLRQYFSKKLSDCKHRTNCRNKSRQKAGRPLMPNPSITVDWCLQQFRQQRGLCAYSDIPMATEPKSAWTCCLGRLDTDAGYSPDNVVFICHSFKVLGQSWSRDLVDHYLPCDN